MDSQKTLAYIDEHFESDFIDPLSDFVRIPNLTPLFDPEYLTNGLVNQAIKHVKEYAESLNLEGLTVNVYEEEGYPPLVIIIYEGTGSPNVMMYGHLDKQPHMDGWMEGTGAITPAIIDGRLYGRGTTDDGYVSFAVLLAIKNALEQGIPLPRITLVLETEEESSSPNLKYLLGKVKDWILSPDYCVSWDSSVLDYNSLWVTSSMRGNLGVNMKVSWTQSAHHSGRCGGAVPESFRILNSLIDRIEDPQTRRCKDFEVEIPERAYEEAKTVVEIIGDEIYKPFHFLEGVTPLGDNDLEEIYMNIRWRPAVAITGIDGVPPLSKAGNLIRPSTSVRFSMRLPPTLKSDQALEQVINSFTVDVPNNAHVEILKSSNSDGWCIKELKESTKKVFEDSSKTFFEKTCNSVGGGGSIPFLNVISEMFPNTEVLPIGLSGEDAKIHAPNENLNLSYAKKLICCISHILVNLE